VLRSRNTAEPCAKCVIGPHAQASAGTNNDTLITTRHIAIIERDRTMGVHTPQAELRALVAGLRAKVEDLRAGGLRGFPRVAAAAVPRVSGGSPPIGSEPTDRTPAERRATAVPVTSAPARGDLFLSQGVRQATTLEALRAEIGDCQRCKLCSGRTQIVFGVGNASADLMFVGEGPGRDEDLRGEPFVGRAGQLLTEIITKGMKMRREDVYIANVIKCRPPENRNPEPDEIAACEPFLLRQIEIVKPKVIVALGKFAAQTLLRDATPISRLRGRWFDYHGIRLMPTLHPAYLLRNPNDKRLVWEDVKLVLKELGAPR
jgi:uracil-DNA glycosylase family 4